MPTPYLRSTAFPLSLAALALATSLLIGCVTPISNAGQAPEADSAPSMVPPAPSAAETPLAQTAAPESDDKQRPAGWNEESHSNDVAPNYQVVFPIDAVQTLTITITPDDWAAMQADMEDIYAASLWIREAMIAAGPDLSLEERTELLQQLYKDRAAAIAASAPSPTATAQVTGAVAAAQAGGEEFSGRSPMWAPATISFQGQQWTHVGVRYKGASSLSPWLLLDLHLPFKFDFDQFEDDYPEIKNQRFFGFKQLSLANNFQDPSGMRDTLVYDLLTDAGLPSLRTAPYEIVLDYGEGPVRLGLYTMVEVVDDTGIPSYFGSDDGNIYEGAGWGATLSVKHADTIEDSFEKKNNEKKADWSDIRALYDVLQDPRRTTDPAAWRAELEAIFDVDGFLEWLGIATVVGHVDTYGSVPHNFYLYNNPSTGKLTWFSWDHNMTFGEQYRSVFTLDRAYNTDTWPLIRFLLDDPVYAQRYVELLAANSSTVLAPDALSAKIRAHAEAIAPFAIQGMSQEEYDAAVQALVDYVEARAVDIESFLAEQE